MRYEKTKNGKKQLLGGIIEKKCLFLLADVKIFKKVIWFFKNSSECKGSGCLS